MAAECELALSTVRDHLRVLEEEGLILGRTVHTGMRGRPPTTYEPVREAIASVFAHERAVGAQERGERWRAVTDAADADPDDPSQAQLDVLYEHLEDAGLEPAVDEQSLGIGLAPCVYHDLLDSDKDLVCSVHARLVQDVLDQVDGPLTLERLDPFVTAHACHVQLTHDNGTRD